jgi:hypothetical protein
MNGDYTGWPKMILNALLRSPSDYESTRDADSFQERRPKDRENSALALVVVVSAAAL